MVLELSIEHCLALEYIEFKECKVVILNKLYLYQQSESQQKKRMYMMSFSSVIKKLVQYSEHEFLNLWKSEAVTEKGQQMGRFKINLLLQELALDVNIRPAL